MASAFLGAGALLIPPPLLTALLQPLLCLLIVILVANMWLKAAGGAARAAVAAGSAAQARARVQPLASLLSVSILLLSALTKHDDALLRSPTARANLAAATALLIAAGALPVLAPRFYLRYRTPLFVAVRVAFFAMPGLRDPRAISNVFQGEPHGGPFGRLIDWWTLAIGVRGLALMLCPTVLPLPLLPHLATLGYALQRVRTTADVCARPMLRSPAWQRRIRWAHLTAEQLLLARAPPHSIGTVAAAAGSLGDSSGGGSGGGGEDLDFDCRQAVAFFQLILACLSLLLAAYIEVPQVPAAAAARPRHRHSRHAGACRRAVAACRRCTHAAEEYLATLCAVLNGQAFPGVIQLACWLLLLSFLWTLAVILEQPGLSLPPQLPAAG